MKRSNWRRWSIMAKAIIWLMIKLIECCLQKSSKTILPTFDYNNLFYWVSWKLLSKTHFETSLLHSVGNWKLFLYLEIQLIFYLSLTEARAELVREFLENWWMEWLKKLTFIICHIKTSQYYASQPYTVCLMHGHCSDSENKDKIRGSDFLIILITFF